MEKKKTNKQLNRTFLIAAAIALCIIAVALVDFLREYGPDHAQYGNDISNTANGGYVAELGENVYYSNAGIWVKLQDAEAYELTENRAAALAIYENALYFSNLSDNNRCYRMDLDGKNLEKLTDFSIDYLNIADGTLYFVCNKETGTRGVYSMAPDGSNLTQLSDRLVSRMIALRGRLYYVDRDRDSSLYSMEFDGSDVKCVTEDYTYCMTTDGKKLLCSTENGIFRMDCDGTNVKQISETHATALLAVGDMLYYSRYSYDSEDKTTGIYRCHASTGKQLTRIREDQAMYLGIGGEMLYFKSLEEGMVVMRSNLDGTEGTFVAGGETTGMLD